MKAALFDEAHFFFTPVHGRIREMFQNPVGPFCTAYQNEKHTGLQRKNQIKRFILSDVKSWIKLQGGSLASPYSCLALIAYLPDIMLSGTLTATTSPRAQISFRAERVMLTTTLRPLISLTLPRSSKSASSGVGRR